MEKKRHDLALHFIMSAGVYALLFLRYLCRVLCTAGLQSPLTGACVHRPFPATTLTVFRIKKNTALHRRIKAPMKRVERPS